MNTTNQNRRRFQFSLRSLFLLLLLFAIACSFVKWLGLLFFVRMFERGAGMVGNLFALFNFVPWICWGLAQLFSRRCGGLCRTWTPVLILSIILIPPTSYMTWTWYQTVFGAYLWDPAWPRAAPYADRALNNLNAYFDRRYRAGPGMLKIHSEWPRVCFTVSAVTFTLTGITGGYLGLLAPLPSKHRLKSEPPAELVT